MRLRSPCVVSFESEGLTHNSKLVSFHLGTGKDMKHLVTGAAGFIGMQVALRLLERGAEVVGVDNLNDYYDVRLKQDRLAVLRAQADFRFFKLDLADARGVC